MPQNGVRYLRCTGPDVTDNPAGAATFVVRQQIDGDEWVFAGYAILNGRDEVIEKSNWYGRYEEEDDWIERRNECRIVLRDEFAAAWKRPYASRALLRRFLSNVNGASDERDPSEDDRP